MIRLHWNVYYIAVVSPIYSATAEFMPSHNVTQNENTMHIDNINDSSRQSLSLNIEHLLVIQVYLYVTVTNRYKDTTNTLSPVPSYDDDSIDSSMMHENDQRFMITVDEFRIDDKIEVKEEATHGTTTKMTTIEHEFHGNDLQCHRIQIQPPSELVFNCTTSSGMIDMLIPTQSNEHEEVSKSTTTVIVGLWRVIKDATNHIDNAMLMTKQLVHLSKYEMVVPIVLHAKFYFQSNESYHPSTINDVLSNKISDHHSSRRSYTITMRSTLIYIAFITIMLFFNCHYDYKNESHRRISAKQCSNLTSAATPSEMCFDSDFNNNHTSNESKLPISIHHSRTNSGASDTCSDEINTDDDEHAILLRTAVEIDSSEDDDDLSPPCVERCMSTRLDLHVFLQHQYLKCMEPIHEKNTQLMLETLQDDTKLENINHEPEQCTTRPSIAPDSLQLNPQQNIQMYDTVNDLPFNDESENIKNKLNHLEVNKALIDTDCMLHLETEVTSVLIPFTNVMSDHQELQQFDKNPENIITKNLEEDILEEKFSPHIHENATSSFLLTKSNTSILSPKQMGPTIPPWECNKEQSHTAQSIDSEDYIDRNLLLEKNMEAQGEMVQDSLDSKPIIATNTSDTTTTEFTPISNIYQNGVPMQNVVTASIDVYDGKDPSNKIPSILAERSIQCLELYPIDEMQPKRLDFIDTKMDGVSKRNRVILETIEVSDDLTNVHPTLYSSQEVAALETTDIISSIPISDVSLPEIHKLFPNDKILPSPCDDKATTKFPIFNSTDATQSSRKKRKRSKFGCKDVETSTSSFNLYQTNLSPREEESVKQKQMSPDFSYVSTLPPNSICSDDTPSIDQCRKSDTILSGQCKDRRTNDDEGMMEPIFGLPGKVITKSIDMVHHKALSTTLDAIHASVNHVNSVKRNRIRKRGRNFSNAIPCLPISNSLLLAIEDVKENVWIFDEESLTKSLKRSKKTKAQSLPKTIQVYKGEQGYL
jgi:hypothetical protein